MVPPRLKLVADNTDLIGGDPSGDDAAAAEARELAAALSNPESGLPPEVTGLVSQDRRERLRILEALLFASSEPLDERALARHLADEADVAGLLRELQDFYAARGVNLVCSAGTWMFQTAGDLAYLLERYAKEERRLSKAALETLAIVAYHQPVTRAEIEEIRGVSISPGTLDILLETGWVRPRGRRRAPGKPITYGTTDSFLTHFSLASIKDLPGLADLKAAGLLDSTLPPGFTVPEPADVASLMPDELPLEAGDEEDAEAGLDLESSADEELLPEGESEAGGHAPGSLKR
jgi:segregation and condensation protein B